MISAMHRFFSATTKSLQLKCILTHTMHFKFAQNKNLGSKQIEIFIQVKDFLQLWYISQWLILGFQKCSITEC